jgi:hypothetical protein
MIWLYDHDSGDLQIKVRFFTATYESERAGWKAAGRPADPSSWVSRSLKWTSELEAYLRRDAA